MAKLSKKDIINMVHPKMMVFGVYDHNGSLKFQEAPDAYKLDEVLQYFYDPSGKRRFPEDMLNGSILSEHSSIEEGKKEAEKYGLKVRKYPADLLEADIDKFFKAKRRPYLDKISELRKYGPPKFLKACVWMLRQSLATSELNESDLFYLLDKVRKDFLELVPTAVEDYGYSRDYRCDAPEAVKLGEVVSEIFNTTKDVEEALKESIRVLADRRNFLESELSILSVINVIYAEGKKRGLHERYNVYYKL